MSSLLEIRDLKVNYGGIEALKGVSFDVKEGEIVTLIGANGAGKSTTLRAIMSVVNPAYLREDKDAIEHDIEHVYSLFPRLKERHWQQAGTLSGGEQQMLAVGRALMAKPKVMMMDEPSLGLAPLVVKDIFSIIRRINDDGVTVLLIEQNANAALKIADRGYVLQTGNVTMTGTGMELLNDESIKEAYLGKK